jgi:26S proteasome regulatory subunit N1
MTPSDSSWVHKNKGMGMLSAVASLGLIMMWNLEEGGNLLDKYFSVATNVSDNEYLKAGACLGFGLASCGIRNESDITLSFLADSFDSASVPKTVRMSSILGLGLGYAGSQREEVKELLENVIINSEVHDLAEASLASLALGLVFSGSCNDDLSSTILQRLMETDSKEFNAHPLSRFLLLGLGLLFLQQGEKVDVILETVRAAFGEYDATPAAPEEPAAPVPVPATPATPGAAAAAAAAGGAATPAAPPSQPNRGKYAEITLITCAYAGSGNVLKIQEMLRLCTEHLTDANQAEHQQAAVLGLSLIAMGEEVGTEMTLRTFEHLLHYGEMPIRRAVPLALALLYISNPEYPIIDQFSRLSHDGDAEVAQNAILGLGLVSAGSANSRVANTLKQLADFYAKEPNHLFMIRLAQGWNMMGKGLLSLSPFHSDRLLLSGCGLAGILTVLHAAIDTKANLLLNEKYHYLLFCLTPAMNPRYLLTVDKEKLELIKTNVRVGLAVETVGQAGRPKTITGFQVSLFVLSLHMLVFCFDWFPLPSFVCLTDT